MIARFWLSNTRIGCRNEVIWPESKRTCKLIQGVGSYKGDACFVSWTAWKRGRIAPQVKWPQFRIYPPPLLGLMDRPNLTNGQAACVPVETIYLQRAASFGVREYKATGVGCWMQFQWIIKLWGAVRRRLRLYNAA